MKLHWQILIGLLIGIVYGLTLTDYVAYVSWMGQIFLRGLQMVVVPLIFSSMISGISNLKSGKDLGRIGIKTFSYYMVTSLVAIVTGLFFVNLLKPGVGAELNFTQQVEGLDAARNSFGNTLLEIIPKNIFHAFSTGDVLSVIFFAIIFGFFILKLEEKPKAQLTDFFNGIFEVMMKMTMFVIKFAPLGILGLVAEIVAQNSANLLSVFGRLGLYSLAVILGLSFHAFVSLPLILKYFGKSNPLKHYKNMSTALLTAFSTASSNATLPLTMEAVEMNDGVSNKITSFVLPLGATINMDGTALYECVAAMFIAQAYGIELSFLSQVVVVITALLASIGAAGIPMAGLVMISVILTAVGLPLEGLGLILAVDRILDMLRTTVNVLSDTCCAVVIAKSEGETLNV
ncbi:MAG: dicarboxylate/amino acid:cation symporter [Ignavibacteria bacterium CG22_combo_CG10-13_8_21_14_all_37_15]|nr:dicarboxylate/amino acid:cation symporter [Ignavibacteria bacterium]PIP78999.1 MAG: dicarboxylate/amino acid:cation symporter [Ignavibacteria bacterium CG22_combo_CG10-13_8_21_14_all_37_15]